MIRVEYSSLFDDRVGVRTLGSDTVTVGRAEENDIVLDSKLIGERALVLRRIGKLWRLDVRNQNGCRIDNADHRSGAEVFLDWQSRPVDLELYPYKLRLISPRAASRTGSAGRASSPDDDRKEKLDSVALALTGRVHGRLIAQARAQQISLPEAAKHPDRVHKVEVMIEQIAINDEELADAWEQPLARHIAAHCVRSALVRTYVEQHTGEKTSSSSIWDDGHEWSDFRSASEQKERIFETVLEKVSKQLGLSEPQEGDEKDHSGEQLQKIDSGFWTDFRRFAKALSVENVRYFALRHIKKQVKDLVWGYGPLEDLLRLPSISEIMVVSSRDIFVERDGTIEDSGRQFVSDNVTTSVIERIVERAGRRIDKSAPLVDARLPDGSRVNAVIDPIAVSGPTLTIRKFPLERFTMDSLLERGSITPDAAEFLRATVAMRKNIVVSGGTGTGKTTLLNCLGDSIPERERVVTIEDTAELRLSGRHVVRMETKPPNADGAGEYTIRDLVRNALRMRPDRIIVGECRGGEAIDMLQAMNTGHDGSLTTVHANNPRDFIERLEVLVRMGTELPVDAIHRQIISAIDVIVQLTRMPGGKRCVSAIVEITPPAWGKTEPGLRELFAHNRRGELRPTGHLPSFLSEMQKAQQITLETFFPTRRTA